jgi:hypothetical protein
MDSYSFSGHSNAYLKFYLDRKAMEGKATYAVGLFEMKR